MACLIHYQGLKILCRVDVDSCKVEHELVVELEPYKSVLNKLSDICKTFIKNACLYRLKLADR